MKTAVVIRHVAYEGLGTFSLVLEQAGYDIIYLDAGVTDLGRKVAYEADIVVSMGGPISAAMETRFPFLLDEIQLLSHRLENDLPVLGINLGALFMARALGASVVPADPEYGWGLLQISDDDSLLAPLKNQPVFQWNNEMYSLPNGAVSLASTAKCKNRAFRYGRSLALQFYAEFNYKKAEQWFIGRCCEIEHAENISLTQIRSENELYGERLETNSRLMLENWLASLEQNDD